MAFLYILAALAVLYVLSLSGRANHPELKKLRGWAYAHRGLHGNGIPENSMAAFRAALEHGYGIELDLHLMKDGSLAVIHDSSLQRTAGVNVAVEDLTAEDLADYCLEGTEERIPLFSQVLALYAGKAPLIIELKPAKGNASKLMEAACAAMEGYEGSWCMESFDPRCVLWLRRHRPDIIRGQLSSNYFSGKGKLPWILKFALTNNLLNFLTRPDFIAYKYCDRKRLSNFLCRKLWKIQGVTWTLQSQEEYDISVAEGWLPIFEYFTP